MEENKILTAENAEVAAEEFVSFEPSKLTIGLGIGAGVIALGGLAYKFIVKPILNKRKEKAEVEELDAEDVEEVEAEIAE